MYESVCVVKRQRQAGSFSNDVNRFNGCIGLAALTASRCEVPCAGVAL